MRGGEKRGTDSPVSSQTEQPSLIPLGSCILTYSAATAKRKRQKHVILFSKQTLHFEKVLSSLYQVWASWKIKILLKFMAAQLLKGDIYIYVHYLFIHINWWSNHHHMTLTGTGVLLSEGGIMSGVSACGGSMPLLTFCWMKCIARENCSLVSLPICLVSARALQEHDAHWAHWQSERLQLSCKNFWWRQRKDWSEQTLYTKSKCH